MEFHIHYCVFARLTYLALSLIDKSPTNQLTVCEFVH